MIKTKTYWDDVKRAKALVDETLSNIELVKLFHALHDTEHDYPELPEGTYGGSVIDNVTYITWDGERHYGCLVTITMPDGFGKNDENYFMERTWTLVGESAKTYNAAPVYHRLIPVTLNRNDVEVHGKSGSMEHLVSRIVHRVYQDNIIFEDKTTFLNSFSEANANRRFDKTPEEIECYQNKCDALLNEFIKNKIPAGDSRWDDLLFGDRGFQARVFSQLRKKGHSIRLDGEKDSFGWVTCGIVMDGNLMTSDYF